MSAYVVLIGPFGAGKSTLAKALVEDKSRRYHYAIEKQVTSRQKRPDEDSAEYKFVSKAEFEKNRDKYLRIQPNRGLDWNYALQQPRNLESNEVRFYVVLPETATFLRKHNPAQTVVCAIVPRTIELLHDHLYKRDPNISEEELSLRLSHVDKDITQAKELADIVFYTDYGEIKDTAAGLADAIEKYLMEREK